jgi:hypothetical protein
MLAFFSAAVPMILVWSGSLEAATDLLAYPEAKLLLARNVFLFVVSVLMATSIFMDPSVKMLHLIGAVLLVLTAFTWNIVVGLLWLLPSLFTWQAYRNATTTNPSLQADRPPAGGR